MLLQWPQGQTVHCSPLVMHTCLGLRMSTGDAACPAQVHLLRRMLEWQNDLLEEPVSAPQRPSTAEGAAADPGQVQILIVPTFKIEQVQRGTTAGDIIRSKVGRLAAYCLFPVSWLHVCMAFWWMV